MLISTPSAARWSAALAVSLTIVSAPAFAQAPDAAPPDATAQQGTDRKLTDQKTDAEIEELRRRIDLLASEMERLRSGEASQVPALSAADRRALGLGPAASSVYERQAGPSIAGYGEILFERLADADQAGVRVGAESSIDMLRAVLYAGYRFTDRFVFNSEVEFEHGGEEVGVEFAYLDYRVNDHLSARGGMLLIPLGLVNEFHEPNAFVGTRRPETERRILPSTWHENGVGVAGSAGRFSYRAYLVNGMNASGFTADGLRGGRQGGAEAKANDWAFAGRLDVTPTPGVFGGIGLYQGNSAQGQFGSAGAGTSIVELHGQAQIRGFDARVLFARAAVDDAAVLNAGLGLGGAASIGSALHGGYAQLGYDVLSQHATTISLMPFYRFEQLNTQAAVPPGGAADPALDLRSHTLGVELKPIASIVVKADYQRNTNKATSGRDRFNVSLGYAF